MLYLISPLLLTTKTSLHLGTLGSSQPCWCGYIVFLPTKQEGICVIATEGGEGVGWRKLYSVRKSKMISTLIEAFIRYKWNFT